MKKYPFPIGLIFNQRLLLFAFVITLLTFPSSPASAQSLEIMPGHNRIFVDVQWLKPLDQKFRFSLFSRTRATIDYENQADIFSGAYFNVTSKYGVGGSLVGKVGLNGAGGDAGVHYIKATDKITFFGLASVGLKRELELSWFSILRYTPFLGEKWKLYTSLELFTLFNSEGHAFSVQRIRVGVDRKGYQFGLGYNTSQAGSSFAGVIDNFGPFMRKAF